MRIIKKFHIFLLQSDAAATTHESCTTYNILKIARALFRWTGDPDLADFSERAMLNGKRIIYTIKADTMRASIF